MTIMREYMSDVRKILICGLVLFTAFACSKDERDEMMQNNDMTKREQVIGVWDVVNIGVIEDSEEIAIDDKIDLQKAQGDASGYEALKNQFVDKMTIFYNDDKSILVKYASDDLKKEQGYWSISRNGICHIRYGCGCLAVNSDLIIKENGKAYFYTQDKCLKIYIEKMK